MIYKIFLKHIPESKDVVKCDPKWIEHAYTILDGMFALYGPAAWEINSTRENDYVVLSVQGADSVNEAIEMVSKVIREINWTFRGVVLKIYDSTMI